MMDYQEGYNDGLTGNGLQERLGLALRGKADFREAVEYEEGFMDGSRDRKIMLASQSNADGASC